MQVINGAHPRRRLRPKNPTTQAAGNTSNMLSNKNALGERHSGTNAAIKPSPATTAKTDTAASAATAAINRRTTSAGSAQCVWQWASARYSRADNTPNAAPKT